MWNGIGIGIGIGRQRFGSQGGFDPDAQAFFDRVDTAGGTLSATEKEAVNTLVVQMKDDGIWSKMKAVYPMVGASSAACAQNLKSSSFTGTFNGGWTFASTGAQGNGTNGYMSTGLNASTDLTSNSNFHLSIYPRTTPTSGINTDIAIADNSSGSYTFILLNTKLGSDAYLAMSNGGYTLPTVSDSEGFYVNSTTTINTQRYFKNNLLLASDTQTTRTLPNRDFVIGGRNINGTIDEFSSREYAFASIGDGLTDTEASDFYTAVQAFNTTLSREV